MKAWARAIVWVVFIMFITSGDILVPGCRQCPALLGVSALKGKCSLSFNGFFNVRTGVGWASGGGGFSKGSAMVVTSKPAHLGPCVCFSKDKTHDGFIL